MNILFYLSAALVVSGSLFAFALWRIRINEHRERVAMRLHLVLRGYREGMRQ